MSSRQNAPDGETRAARLRRLTLARFQTDQELSSAKARVAELKTELSKLDQEIEATTRELEEIETRDSGRRRRSANGSASAPPVAAKPGPAQVPIADHLASYEAGTAIDDEDEVDAPTIKGRILAAMRGKGPMTVATIAAAVGDVTEKQVLFTLQRVRQREGEKVVAKPGRGLWALADEVAS